MRDHIALVACHVGLTAQIEQNMMVQGQALEGGEPAPGSVRPINRADVHIIEPSGSELWLDVRIHTVAPGLPIARELLREEQTKCRAYGQRHGYDLNQVDPGMIPVVLEQYVRTAPELLVRQGQATYSHAKRQTRHRWLASCSEQHGSPWQNACQHMSRQSHLLTPPWPGRIFSLLRPGLLRTLALLSCYPPEGWQHEWLALG